MDRIALHGEANLVCTNIIIYTLCEGGDFQNSGNQIAGSVMPQKLDESWKLETAMFKFAITAKNFWNFKPTLTEIWEFSK